MNKVDEEIVEVMFDDERLDHQIQRSAVAVSRQRYRRHQRCPLEQIGQIVFYL